MYKVKIDYLSRVGQVSLALILIFVILSVACVPAQTPNPEALKTISAFTDSLVGDREQSDQR